MMWGAMTALPLDSRQARIARVLLDGPAVMNVEQMAAELHLTNRVVRYNLASVEAHLAQHGLRLLKRRGLGVWVEGDEAQRAAVRAGLETRSGPDVLDVADRHSSILLGLLDAAPDPVRSEELEARLGVSGPTVRRDVRIAEAWLEQHRLHLRRQPGVGLSVRGSEVDVRAAMLALVLEHVPANALASQAAAPAAGAGGAPDWLALYLVDLDLPTFRSVLASELREFEDPDPTMLTATLSLAILVHRVRNDHPARLGRGRLRSLLDHPVSEAARHIATAIRKRLAIALGQAEVASITESLLGFAELTDPRAAPEARIVTLVDGLVAAAAVRLHPSLAADELLRANLVEHVRRLQVRLRYGLPVSNPLQHEVQRRYPDVFEVATAVLADLGPMDGVAIPAEEIGFLTMYLAGSLERLRLRQKRRVTVVCPAGMATAWILVSRLLAEFPQLEVVQVVSKAVFELQADEGATDLVISTVPLEGPPAPVPWLVVSPLLEARDVRRLTRLLGLPPQV
jgi:mannitol operon transcriptional antiterminator